MGVRVREWKGAWWVYADSRGKRTVRRFGPGKQGQEAAEAAAKMWAAKLGLGEDIHQLVKRPMTLAIYSQQWLNGLQCKAGTRVKYHSILSRI